MWFGRAFQNIVSFLTRQGDQTNLFDENSPVSEGLRLLGLNRDQEKLELLTEMSFPTFRRIECEEINTIVYWVMKMSFWIRTGLSKKSIASTGENWDFVLWHLNVQLLKRWSEQIQLTTKRETFIKKSTFKPSCENRHFVLWTFVYSCVSLPVNWKRKRKIGIYKFSLNSRYVRLWKAISKAIIFGDNQLEECLSGLLIVNERNVKEKDRGGVRLIEMRM